MLTIRQATEEDAGALYALVDTSRANIGRWLPWAKELTSVADELTFIKDATAKWEAGTAFTFVIEVDGVIVGTIDLHNVNFADSTGEIGYWVGDPYTRRGYARQAVQALLLTPELAGVETFIILVRAGNEASIKVAQAAGFTCTARLRDAAGDLHYLEFRRAVSRETRT